MSSSAIINCENTDKNKQSWLSRYYLSLKNKFHIKAFANGRKPVFDQQKDTYSHSVTNSKFIMMKKTLFVFVVLALIAQICARPEDKEDDSENIAKETAKKAVKEGQDKAAEAGEKGQNEAKAHAGKPKEMFDNLKNKGKESAEALGKHGGNKVESNNPQHQVKMSAVVRKAEVAGEKLIETGTNIFAKMLENMGL